VITNDMIQFRLLQMPCCHMLLCWVNPRLPNYCPECGTHIFLKLKSGEYTRVNDKDAVLRADYGKI
jgi:hypothetical protein